MKRIKKKTESITIRVSKEQKLKIENLAIKRDISITDLFLTIIREDNNGN